MKPKSHIILSAFAVACLASVAPSCERKSAGGEIKDGVNDALDRRPAEGLRDAAEDARDGVKDAAKDTKDAVKDATR